MIVYGFSGIYYMFSCLLQFFICTCTNLHFLGEVPENERLTIGYINERFGKSTHGTKANVSNDTKSNPKIKDHWKTTFQEGVCGDKVSGYNTFLQHQYTQWRYDYAFETSSGKSCLVIIKYKLCIIIETALKKFLLAS